MSRWCIVASLLLPALASPALAAWQTFYDPAAGFDPRTGGWQGAGTKSDFADGALHVVDASTEAGSGRMYNLDWGADPARGAVLEATLRVKSCSAPWGVCLFVSDGRHEEGISFFPDRIEMANAKLSAPFDAASKFHTYTVRIRATDIRLEADGTLLLDGAGKFTVAANANRNQCGFGSGASSAMGESYWQLVRYDSGATAPANVSGPAIPGLKVTLGGTQVLAPGATYIGTFKFRDGSIGVGERRSSDGGKTWHNAPGVNNASFEFANGEVIVPGFNTKDDTPGWFTLSMARSTDGGKTFKAGTARLHIPEGTGGTGDDGKRYPGPACDHATVQLRDGSLLMAMYGYFKRDTVLADSFPPEWKLYKYRTFAIRSIDRGRTWEYYRTIAYDGKTGDESFCEPDLLQLPGGDILCLMRTGGSNGKHTPLYQCRSTDDGKTWSTPVPVADRGVWPNACRMRSGVLVCTYGRPDNWLMFSRDDGKTWGGNLCFYRGRTTSYNSVEEVAPGRLLVVYDRSVLDRSGNMATEAVGLSVTVTRR